MYNPGQEGRGPFDSRDRDTLGGGKGVKTYIHVGHGLIEYTVVTKAAQVVLLAGVILVGLQKVIENAMFPHGLTDTLHLLQGDPAEGGVSGPRPAFFFSLPFFLPYLSVCVSWLHPFFSVSRPVCPTHAH